MIHRESRDKLAEALRQYTSCKKTNDDLDCVAVDWRDRGAVAVQDVSWRLYDDMYTHKAKGKHQISGKERDDIARCILFLYSDTEYLWPEYPFRSRISTLFNLLSLGRWKILKQKRFAEFKEAGNFSIWPFASDEQYEEALKSPRLLISKYT